MHLDINLKFALTVALVLIVIGVAAMAHGQDSATTTSPAPTPAVSTDTSKPVHAFTPTADQAKDLEIAQLKEQLAQSQWAAKAQAIPEFAPYQTTAIALQKQCASVIAANHWPATVQCDMQQVPVKFVDTAVAATAAAGVPATAPNTAVKK